MANRNSAHVGGLARPVWVMNPLATSGSDDADTLNFDEITGALVTLEVPHHEVHEGEYFTASIYSSAVGNNATLMLLLRTGATRWDHLVYEICGGGNYEVELLEKPTVTGAGTALTAHNMKRGSPNAAQTTVFHTPTIAGGVLLRWHMSPGGTGGTRSGGNIRTSSEWILDESSDYVVRITNRSGGSTPASIVVEWYEEENE